MKDTLLDITATIAFTAIALIVGHFVIGLIIGGMFLVGV